MPGGLGIMVPQRGAATSHSCLTTRAPRQRVALLASRTAASSALRSSPVASYGTSSFSSVRNTKPSTRFSSQGIPTRAAAAAQQLSTAGATGKSKVGVLIVDHGSRKKASNDMLVHFGILYQQMTGSNLVEVAHMEIAEPTIEMGIGKLAASGATKVVIAPYFLSKGRHIQEDIPFLVKAAQQLHPSIECTIAEPIGIDPLMAQLIHNRVESALRTPP